MRKLKLLLVLLIAFTSCQQEDEEMNLRQIITSSVGNGDTTPEVPVFVVYKLPDNSVWIRGLTGQSNAAGSALLTELLLSERDPFPNVTVNNKNNPELFASLDPENIITTNSNGTGFVGLEVFMALYQQENMEDSMFISKKATGGTAIDEHLPGGAVYEDFWNNFLKYTINYYLGQGQRVFVDLLYLQGEADATDSGVLAYKAKLQQLVSQYQTDLGVELPISLFEIFRANANSIAINNIFHEVAVENAHVEVIAGAEEPDSGDVYGSTITNDFLHWSVAGFRQLSDNYFKRMEGITPLEITELIPTQPQNTVELGTPTIN